MYTVYVPPTRGALLTGQYPFRNINGLTFAIGFFEDISVNIPPGNMFTYFLSNYNNYKTFMAGIWHLGRAQWFDTPVTYFDESVFGIDGVINYYRHGSCLQQIIWPLCCSYKHN